MNKKILILAFLLIMSPVFAEETTNKQEAVIIQTSENESFVPDEIVDEQAPSLDGIKPQSRFKAFNQKVKGIFTRSKTKNNKVNSAKDVEPDEPVIADKKALKSEKKNDSEKIKKEKKTDKKQKKSEKKLKNTYIETEGSALSVNETDAVNKAENNKENNAMLIDTAYQGSVNTTKIMEVDECVKIALEKHPLIKSAMGNAEIYKSKIGQAWANYFPTLSAGISYSRNDMQVANFAFPTQVYDMYYTPTVSGNMLLFDFGKTKAQADLAKRTYEAAQFNLENSINTVIFTVKQAYYNLLFAQQQVKVYEDTVKDYTLHLEQAKAYYNIGTKARIDVITAEHNLGRAKLNLIQAQNTLKIAYVQLSNAMGMPEYSDYDVTDNLAAKAYDINAEDAIKAAFDTNPELLSAKKKADASEMLVRTSKRAFTPNVSGFASYTRGGKRVDTDYGYQFGAQLNYQTVNLMQLKKQVDEAKATYKKDLADYENTKQNIYLEVKQAYLNLTTAQESIGVAKLSMEQAKEQYDQASGRYKVGLGDAIELKDAETTYRNAQLDYYNTLLNYHVSAADLERQMGIPLNTSDVDLL